MKKKRLFKGVSILGAVLLLANIVLPGLQVYAIDDSTNNSTSETVKWYYIHDEESWNAAYQEGSPLYKYYQLNPDEDRWCAPNAYKNEWHYGQEADKNLNNGQWPADCTQAWSGAINATNAKYPWAVLELPTPFKGTISFEYDGGTASYPWGEHIIRQQGYGVASIPEEIDMNFILDANGETSFDPEKLIIKIIPEEIEELVENTNWWYVYNAESWDTANQPGKPLYRYYQLNPDEDRWCAPNAYKNEWHYGQEADKNLNNGQWPADCTQAWSGAINATNAKYPWAVLGRYSEDPENITPISGKIIFKYKGNLAYPRGDNVTIRKYGAASIPEEFNDISLKLDDNGNTTFDKNKFNIIVVTDTENPITLIQAVHSHTVTRNYKDVNGEDVTNDTTTVEHGQIPSHDDVTNYDKDSKRYTFAGWTKDQIDVTLSQEKIIEKVTYTAKYNEADIYTVTFDSNGGSDIDSQTVVNGSTAEKPTDPTKDGYKFAGWYSDEGLNNLYEFTANNPVNQNITLYAKWIKLITVNANSIKAAVYNANKDTLGTREQRNLDKFTVSFDPINKKVTITDNGLEEYNNGYQSGKWIGLVIDFGVLVNGSISSDEISYGIEDSDRNDVDIYGGTDSTTDFLIWITREAKDGKRIKFVNQAFDQAGTTITNDTDEIEILFEFKDKQQSSNSGGGGGGGSSSSYSCKNLPANATANNTTKPKSNTNYSYSTDTGAICTFQCNKGYAWNETNSKCEKAEASTGDTTDEPKTDEPKADDTTADPQEVLSDGLTRELHDAYDFAHENGVTTMPSPAKANMYGPLTRIAMAKMLSQYAINVLGKKPANVVVPEFSDVTAELNEEYSDAVTLAYQLGIMGINIEEFRPFDPVIRAEFATALSRMLYSTPDGEYEGTAQYYVNHLKKLVEEKIITKNDPFLQELRGYVMIMLMRAAE